MEARPTRIKTLLSFTSTSVMANLFESDILMFVFVVLRLLVFAKGDAAVLDLVNAGRNADGDRDEEEQ